MRILLQVFEECLYHSIIVRQVHVHLLLLWFAYAFVISTRDCLQKRIA